MNFVSVIIPAHNASATLPDTLSSVLAQTWPHFEAIVVDDGSSDATRSVIDAFAARDSRIHGVSQAVAGVAAARNHGLRIARGDLIAPLDADDLWHPEKLARQVDRLEQAGSGTGMAYCWSADIDQLGIIIQHRIALDRWEGDVYPPLIYANFIGNGSVPLLRKDVLLAIGGWDPALRAADAEGCEDWQLYLRVARRSDVVLTPGFLVGYRQRMQSMSRNVRAMRRSFQLVIAEAKRDRPDLPEWLFRWSVGAFNLYAAELLLDAGDKAGALRAAASGVWHDPAWLGRRSTVGKILRAAKHRVGLRPPPNSLPPPAFPIGRHFDQLVPEPNAEAPEGSVIRRQEARIDTLRRRAAIAP